MGVIILDYLGETHLNTGTLKMGQRHISREGRKICSRRGRQPPAPDPWQQEKDITRLCWKPSCGPQHKTYKSTDWLPGHSQQGKGDPSPTTTWNNMCELRW